MKTYVVAVGDLSTHLISRILEASGMPEVVVVSGGRNRTGAASYARSLLGTRRHPVALVLDARTYDADFAREQEREYFSLARGGSAPLRLFMAVPELEAVLFSDPATLERILERPIPADVLFEAQFRPRVVLQRLLDESHPGRDLSWVPERIDDEAGCAYARHPLVCSLIAFLRNPSAWSPHAAAA